MALDTKAACAHGTWDGATGGEAPAAPSFTAGLQRSVDCGTHRTRTAPAGLQGQGIGKLPRLVAGQPNTTDSSRPLRVLMPFAPCDAYRTRSSGATY
jgi:hypothetical protein